MQNSTQKEVTLKDILLLFLRKFSRIFITAVVFAVILGALGVWKGYRSITDAATVEKQREDYLLKLDEFNASVKQLRNELDQAERRRNELREYTEKSIYYNLDSYNESVAEIVFYIDTGYQIMPSIAYQNPNKTGDVVSAYCDAYRSAELYEGISEIIGEAIDEKYLDELIEVGRAGDIKIKDSLGNVTIRHADGNNAVISIQARYSDKETAGKIAGFVFETLSASVAENVAPHTTSVITESAMTVIDEELSKIQESTAKELEEVDAKIQTKGAELTQKERTAPQEPSVSKMSVLKKGLLYGVAGGVLGGILACIALLLSFLSDSRLGSAACAARLYNLELLGTLREKEDKKEKKLLFGRLIARLEGDDRVRLSNGEAAGIADASVRMIAVQALIDDRFLPAVNKQTTIAVTGTMTAEQIKMAEQCMEKANQTPSFRYIPVDSVLRSGAAVDQLQEADGVILAEHVNSLVPSINKEILRIEKLGKPILGMLIIE